MGHYLTVYIHKKIHKLLIISNNITIPGHALY